MTGNAKYVSDEKLHAYGESAARLYRSKGRQSVGDACGEISAALARIDAACAAMRKTSGGEKSPAACEWLADNRYLAQREGKAALRCLRREKQLRSGDEGIVLLALAKSLVHSGAALSEKRIRLFLEGCQSVGALPCRELYLFPAALRAALVLHIAELCEKLCEEDWDSAMAEAFTSLRFVASTELHALLESVDLCERLLRKDPAGIYPKMDDASRALYRRRLSQLARQSAMDEQGFAKQLLKKCQSAEGEARHVGFELLPQKERSGALYIAANLLLTLFLSLLCGFLSKSVAAALLLLLPLSELTKSLLDYLIGLYTEPRQLPRLDMSAGIPDTARTVCVISSLISEPEGIRKLTRHLEELHLSNRSKGGNLFFGILADLPEADSPVTAKDAGILSAAKAEIEALNEKYGGLFYLFTRPRTEDKSRGKFSGHERKRGAVLELARLLCGSGTELAVTAGKRENLAGTRYIITLDGDTEPTPESLLELIGAMAHPLNAPVCDRERGLVMRGHGILHPRMGCELSSLRRNDFSRIFAGSGGTEPYSALCGELYMDLYGRGGFSGKGILDAECLLLCSEKHIPDGKVLSHDALEGAFLRGGYLSDTEFLDSFPSSPPAYYRRMHRWMRGDWQNAPWIFKKSGMAEIDRWKLFDSVRRTLVPPLTFAAVFTGLLCPAPGLVLAAWAALLSLASRLLIALTEFSSQRIGSGREKTHSRLVKGVTAAFLQTFLRLWFLPYEAWICLSAAALSLWRMAISHKNLLQWETSAQAERRKNSLGSYFLHMLFCPISGTVLFLLSSGIAAKTVGLLWGVAPLAALALALPAKNGFAVKDADKAYLLGCAKEIWHYFATFCTPADNFLPPDNFQEQPPVGLAHRTSPTNIGMALLSAVCAYEMKLDRRGALTVIGGMLSTLEKLPRFGGHFLNWYDTRTLRPLEPKYISTVDSGNLCACLIVLKNWFLLRGSEEDAERVGALLRDMDFAPLFDPSAQLFTIGFDLTNGRPSPSHYDLMASEARLTSYLAVARGDVPRKHWRSLSRALLSADGYKGMASWSGTMFEYLMPELFLPLTKDSLMYETAKFCLRVQKRRKSPDKLWGISESAFFALDSALNYCYKAHGCADLALKRGQDAELVIAPYASFLALAVDPAAALPNLRRLEKAGLRGVFGFLEALDFTPSRCRSESGEKVRCYMAHHLGMSMLSICNYVNQGLVRELFMAEPCMRAYRRLTEEKLPLNTPALRLTENERGKDEKTTTRRWTQRGESFDFEAPACCVLSNGMYNIMLTSTGLTCPSWDGLWIYKAPSKLVGDGHGVEISLDGVSLLPEVNIDYNTALWELSESEAEITLIRDELRSQCSIAVGGADMGEVRIVSLCPKKEMSNASLRFSFEPVLADKNDYVNHPAYWRLGLEAQIDSGCLLLHRLSRGEAEDLYLCLACDRRASFSADRSGGTGALAAPFVTASVALDLEANAETTVRFALCAARSPEAAFAGAQRLLSMSRSDGGCMVTAAASRLRLSPKELDSAMAMLLPLCFPQPEKALINKQNLWGCGISGDLPVVCCGEDGADRETVPSLVRQFCLLRSCGIEFDLVFLSSEGGDYRRPVWSDAHDTLAAVGLESFLDISGGVHVLPLDAAETVRSSSVLLLGAEPRPGSIGAVYHLPYSLPRKHGAVPKHAYDRENSFIFYVNQDLPARCWSHVLTNGRFGALACDSGCGNMWYENAREMRLGPWKNDPYAVFGPETLEYVTAAGRYSLFAANDGFPCRVKFGAGCAVWEKSFGEAAFRVTAFVPQNTDARVLILESKGSTVGRICWKTELLLAGDERDRTGLALNFAGGVFSARNRRSGYSGTALHACFSSDPLGHTGEYCSHLRGEYDGKTTGLTVPVFAAEFACMPTLIIVCGCGDGKELIKLCKPDAAYAELDLTGQHWRTACERLRLHSAYPALDRYAGGWAAYQTLACRLLGRCSLYQSGGAVGFRDQLQDAVNMILLDPSLAREQILACCAHQYPEGDVLHWWHSLPEGEKGVRTRCSDDLLWLAWALCEYTEKTGDTSLCEEKVCYVNSVPLSPEERDRYEMPLQTELRESVIDHARRAVDGCINRGTGLHGLLFFGSGDWNDGMDRVKGESVWLSWFFAHTVRRFADLLVELCKPDADRYRALAERIGRAANEAWDGAWYLRGYWADGLPLGSAKSEFCRIDSVAQSWAAFCADASNSRIDAALDSAVTLLYDRENGLVKLFDPPFAAGTHDPGYIRSYGAGFRENGGQYTHAAIWLAMALIKRGRPRDGLDILLDLLPEGHDGRVYAAEPFILPADVYTAEGHVGEAGWTWYTGSSGWYFRIVYEELFGLKPWRGSLYIRPDLPEDFPPCELEITLLGQKHRIGLTGGEIFLDGEKYDGKGIPFV